MFQPIFVYDSRSSSLTTMDRLRDNGFRCVDIRDPLATVHGGNPAIVVYDVFAYRATIGREKEFGYRFSPPKKTAVMAFTEGTKGFIWGLPEPIRALEAITGKKVMRYSSLTTNFELGADL